MPNFITIKKLKELTNGIINIKPLYSNISDNYAPTYRELKEGKFFNRFVDNNNPSFIIVGIRITNTYNDCYSVNEEDVELIFPRLSSISIYPVDYIPPCGIITNLSCSAKFNLISKTLFDEKSDIRCGDITANWKSSNKFFEIEGSTLTVDTNSYGKEIETTISAAYSYSGNTQYDSVLVTQEENRISDWQMDYDTTDKIKMTITPDIIPNNGGQSKIRVIRYFTKHLVKKDSCGKVWETSATSCHQEDVSYCSEYHNTNDKHFIRKSTTICTKKQELNSLEQSSIFTAIYKEFTDSAIITQNKGGVISYTYDLQFLETDTKIITKILDTSILTNINIPLISNKNMLIDGVYFSSIIYDKLKITKSDDWYNVTIDDSTDEIQLHIDIIEVNHNRTNQKMSNILIENEETKEIITITLIQPQSTIIETVWDIYLSGGGNFNNHTISGARITFKPSKKDVYEDGTWDVCDIVDNDIRITYDSESTNTTVLDGGVLKRRNFNGLHDMKPIYNENMDMEDVRLTVHGFIEDRYGDVLAESKPVYIILEGVTIPTYTYELCFQDGNHYNELNWEYNQIDTKLANITSLKHTYLNGVKTKSEECEFKLKPIDEWGEFSIITKQNNIECKPFDINLTLEDYQYEYEIIQTDYKDNKINLYLNQHANNSFKTVNLNVVVHKETINDNVWINDNPIMTIYKDDENIKTIPLSTCWLYPSIIDNSDTIYSNTIELQLGAKYEFVIRNIKLMDNTQCNNVEHIVNMDESVNNIEIKIEI